MCQSRRRELYRDRQHEALPAAPQGDEDRHRPPALGHSCGIRKRPMNGAANRISVLQAIMFGRFGRSPRPPREGHSICQHRLGQANRIRRPANRFPKDRAGLAAFALLRWVPTGLLGEKRELYGTTRKDALLESVPPGVTTWTFPLLAPAGTVVVISELETTSKTAAVPLKPTLVAPVRSVPRILTAAPTLPKGGRGFTNGPKPTDRLNTVPPPKPPPVPVVP